jgi:hypothetical protein
LQRDSSPLCCSLHPKKNSNLCDVGLQLAGVMYAEDLLAGFVVPPLIRFVNGESPYLANANGGPRMFFNIEDHLSKSTGVINTKFQVRITDVLCLQTLLRLLLCLLRLL